MDKTKIIIGKNNEIANSVIIHENVTIGDNNFIGENVVIYPNTVIGNNNNIFNGNIIGEMPINSDDSFREYNLQKYKGVLIGDNNLFHVKNIVFSGIENKTLIQNNNKILGDCHLHHDVQIYNYVTFYPRVSAAGFSEFLNHSNVGICAVIHQRKIIGQYSMVGGNNMVTKNVFPYYININNKIHRLNKVKIPEHVNIFDECLREIEENAKNKNFDLSSYDLPIDIKEELQLFISKVNK